MYAHMFWTLFDILKHFWTFPHHRRFFWKFLWILNDLFLGNSFGIFYDYKSPPLRPKNIVVKLPMKLFSSWWLLSGLIWSRSALETNRKSAPGIEPRSRRCRASVPVLPGTPYAEGRLGLLSPGDKIRPGPLPLLSLASGGCQKNMYRKLCKVQIFWEGHKNLSHLPLIIWCY